jgi:hypothetical protein
VTSSSLIPKKPHHPENQYTASALLSPLWPVMRRCGAHPSPIEMCVGRGLTRKNAESTWVVTPERRPAIVAEQARKRREAMRTVSETTETPGDRCASTREPSTPPESSVRDTLYERGLSRAFARRASRKTKRIDVTYRPLTLTTAACILSYPTTSTTHSHTI